MHKLSADFCSDISAFIFGECNVWAVLAAFLTITYHYCRHPEKRALTQE